VSVSVGCWNVFTAPLRNRTSSYSNSSAFSRHVKKMCVYIYIYTPLHKHGP
jgi:hypothetical protein